MKGEAFSNQKDFEAKVLKALFDGLAERRVRYAVLRNYEDLPQSVGARDIDILVHPDDLAGAIKVIAVLSDSLNAYFAKVYCDDMIVQIVFARRLDVSMLFQLKIDLLHNRQVYGVELLTADQMLADARVHKGIPVVADDIQFLDKWLFNWFVGQPTDPKYNDGFSTICLRDRDRIFERLGPLAGVRQASNDLDQVSYGRASEIVPLPRFMRLARLVIVAARSGPRASIRLSQFAYHRVINLLSPKGIFLSISGPDGSGKTTVIDMVIQQLGEIYGNDAVTYAHFRPTVLPRIAEMAKEVRAVKTVDENYNQPHRAEPSGVIGSAARLIYYWLDYFAGYFRRIFPILKRREIVLFDRYYYDMIADPFRSRINLPMSVLRLVGRLLPLPRFAFFIRVAPDEILRRKQELTMERVITLNARYGDLVQRGWLIPIDNDGAPQEAAAAIVDHIVSERDRKARRVLQRMIK
ncbi:MAG: hypothetical protein WCY02_00670 [Parvibaculum sp.]